MVLSGNGQEFFIDADGAFGVCRDGKGMAFGKRTKRRHIGAKI